MCKFPLKIINLYLLVLGQALTYGQSRLVDLTFREGRALCGRYYAGLSGAAEESKEL